jgi:hypothetical protein
MFNTGIFNTEIFNAGDLNGGFIGLAAGPLNSQSDFATAGISDQTVAVSPISAAGASTTLVTALDFQSRNQSIWGGGPAIGTTQTISIFDLNESIPGMSLDLEPIGIIAASRLYADIGLNAVFDFTSGSISLDHPVNAAITVPTTVAPGQVFAVSTGFAAETKRPACKRCRLGWKSGCSHMPTRALTIFE